MKTTGFVSLCAIAVAGLAGSAHAVIVDLTAGNQSGTINGAVYANQALTPAGSGVIESFVRVSAANQNTVQGYNTSARPLSFDENTSPTFTRDLKFGDVPTVNIGGNLFKEFLLDINQTNASPLLSLNQVAIFTKASGGASGNNIFNGSLGTAVYQMNTGFGPGGSTITGGGAENRVQLNYSLQSGSGQSDMFLYVPLANFGAANANTFIYLYSFFGLPSSNNDGYEEWAVRSPGGPVVPLPPAAWAGLAGLGAVGVTGFVRRRRMA